MTIQPISADVPQMCEYMSSERQQKSCTVQNLDQEFGPSISRSLFQPHRQPPVEVKGPCPAPVATSSCVLGSTSAAALDTLLAEGAASLLAMASAADTSDLSQVSFEFLSVYCNSCRWLAGTD